MSNQTNQTEGTAPAAGSDTSGGSSGAAVATGPDQPSTKAESPGEAGAPNEVSAAEPSVSAVTEADARIAELTATVAALTAENSDLKDQYLRKQADFENFRKRLMRDKEDSVAFANQQLLLDLVAVIDDFERAIRSTDESRDFDALHGGVVLIEKNLVGLLERKYGCERFESEGEEFDPQRHEAVTSEARADLEHPTVLEEYLRGYTLNGRILRSAKVKVSAPAGGTADNA